MRDFPRDKPNFEAQIAHKPDSSELFVEDAGGNLQKEERKFDDDISSENNNAKSPTNEMGASFNILGMMKNKTVPIFPNNIKRETPDVRMDQIEPEQHKQEGPVVTEWQLNIPRKNGSTPVNQEKGRTEARRNDGKHLTKQDDLEIHDGADATKCFTNEENINTNDRTNSYNSDYVAGSDGKIDKGIKDNPISPDQDKVLDNSSTKSQSRQQTSRPKFSERDEAKRNVGPKFFGDTSYVSTVNSVDTSMDNGFLSLDKYNDKWGGILMNEITNRPDSEPGIQRNSKNSDKVLDQDIMEGNGIAYPMYRHDLSQSQEYNLNTKNMMKTATVATLDQKRLIHPMGFDSGIRMASSMPSMPFQEKPMRPKNLISDDNKSRTLMNSLSMLYAARKTPPPNSGFAVLKLVNISWNLGISDIVSYFNLMQLTIGHQPPHYTHSIHIIMNRATGKTHSECFVEFPTYYDALTAIERHPKGILKGRVVTTHWSSQAELFNILFPNQTVFPTKKMPSLDYQQNEPIENQRHNEAYQMNQKQRQKTNLSDGNYMTDFSQQKAYSPSRTGVFLQREEINAILVICRNYKLHFSRKCAERPFENIISIITKVPWNNYELVSATHRDHLFEMIKLGLDSLRIHLIKSEVSIDETLFVRMLRAGLCVPLFTERQKITLLNVLGMSCPPDLVQFVYIPSSPCSHKGPLDRKNNGTEDSNLPDAAQINQNKNFSGNKIDAVLSPHNHHTQKFQKKSNLQHLSDNVVQSQEGLMLQGGDYDQCFSERNSAEYDFKDGHMSAMLYHKGHIDYNSTHQTNEPGAEDRYSQLNCDYFRECLYQSSNPDYATNLLRRNSNGAQLHSNPTTFRKYSYLMPYVAYNEYQVQEGCEKYHPRSEGSHNQYTNALQDHMASMNDASEIPGLHPPNLGLSKDKAPHKKIQTAFNESLFDKGVKKNRDYRSRFAQSMDVPETKILPDRQNCADIISNLEKRCRELESVLSYAERSNVQLELRLRKIQEIMTRNSDKFSLYPDLQAEIETQTNATQWNNFIGGGDILSDDIRGIWDE